jgi:hypothetical protein
MGASFLNLINGQSGFLDTVDAISKADTLSKPLSPLAARIIRLNYDHRGPSNTY